MDTVLNPNTAYDYTREAVYDTYLRSCIEQEYRINLALSEAAILNESGITMAKKSAKIKALYEAKLSDTIKSKFNQFIQFIKNVWGKFMANMTKVLANEETYLKKYSSIINGKKGNPEIKISYYGNYDKGIDRITSVTVPQFDWNTHAAALKEESDGKFLEMFLGSKGFQYDQNEELASQLKKFFTGAEDGQTEKTMDQFNLKSAYNYCMNFKKIESVTKKDINNIEASASKIQAAIAQNIKDNQAQASNTTTQTTQQNQQKSDIKLKDDNSIKLKDDNTSSDNSNKSGLSLKKEESAIDLGLYQYLREAEEEQKGLTIDVSKAAGSGTSKMSDDEANAQANTASTKGGDDASKIVDKYTRITKAVITAKWTAAEQIAKDYMKIINAHVKSYVGKTDKPNENKNTDTAKQYTNDENNPNKQTQ